MSNPIMVNILSDDDDEEEFQSKKQKRNSFDSNPVLIIDDEQTPFKSKTPSSFVVPETPLSTSVVPETPLEEAPFSFRCKTTIFVSQPDFMFSPAPLNPPSGLICLESDEEPDRIGSSPGRLNEAKSLCERQEELKSATLDVENNFEVPLTCSESSMLQESSSFPSDVQDDFPQTSNYSEEDDILPLANNNIQISDHFEEDDIQPLASNNVKMKDKTKGITNKKRSAGDLTGRVRSTKEEKARLLIEKKQQKEQEKLEKVALKEQAAEMKKMQKEIERWEKGKFAQQSIVAKIDTKVVEQGSVGGQLLTRLAEKGVTFQITSNPVERSIIWTMSVPDNIAQALTRGTEIPYVLLVFEAEEFCRLVANESLMHHVSRVQSIYPSHTICFLTNRLLAYINKREQEHYKNPGNRSGWSRPPVEQLLSKLSTHFVGVHSRLCTDEAELAEHVVGLTCSLASCQFRKKLTRLSVNANGCLIPKDATDRALIKKSTWLKALVAIPKVQPRFAIAIWKKYPTMKSLLKVYMDPAKSEHEKEFLLANLVTEGLVGDNRRLGEICSKRVYRILMARSGSTKTDDVESGADFFNQQAS
uniref:crossover junction endonuclease EME1B n=1 Tax=Erigeron canadensis TaxID=72917 RepID=UPI001CB9636A|nr:crossover junction endonuclease EME1B [Erigeron canadensis]XP_043634277.1 crossover junction endonuclease EME1B [Erigeron canadensis]